MKAPASKVSKSFEDIFAGRDKTTFIQASTERRIGWEATLGAGDAYCEYLLQGEELNTVDEIALKGYSLANTMVSAMNTPLPVALGRSSKASYTDGRTIVLNTAPLQDGALAPAERIDVLLGEAVHETAHVLYTDMDDKKALMSKAERDGYNVELLHFIWNVVEDEYIEIRVGDDTPGYSRYLEKVKYYFFDHLFMQELPEYSKMNDSERLMTTFLHLVRYPKYVREEDLVEFKRMIGKIKKILTPYPSSTEQCLGRATDIYKLLAEEFKEMQTPTKSKAGQGDGEGEEAGGIGSQGEGPPPTEKEMEEMLKELKKLLEAGKVFISSVDAKESKAQNTGVKKVHASKDMSKKAKAVIDKLYSQEETGIYDSTKFHRQPDAAPAYQASYMNVHTYASAISRHLKFASKNSRLIHKSTRSGHLDTTKLAEAVQGVQTVYERHGEIRTQKGSVCLLVDESGSMVSKIKVARETAILFREALKRSRDVQLFIYGHTADLDGASTDIYIYQEPGHTPQYSLGNVEARSNNRDGVAIFEVASRIRKFTKSPCAMFVLSDGAPNASNYGGTSHTREMVTKVERMGFSVVQIAIEHSFDPSTMFTKYLVLDNLDKLAQDLGSVMKQVVAEMTRSIVIEY